MDASCTVEQLRNRIGTVLGVSHWLRVEQGMIDAFAQSTKDPDRLHVNPTWAARETPYGGTIASGFWTLSMLTYFSHEVGMWPQDVDYALNYGLDRVRWVHPLKMGENIRMRCTLMELTERGAGRLLIRTGNIVQIEGEPRPALSAEWLGLFVRESGASNHVSGKKERRAPDDTSYP